MLAQMARQKLPDSANVADTLGWAFYKLGSAESAVAQLKESVQKAPRNPVYQYHLGMAYVQTGDWERAKSTLHRALALKADFDGAADARKALTLIGA